MMKFLVLALCVCAASAASFVRTDSGVYKPWQKPVQAVESAVEVVAEAVVSPTVTPVPTLARTVVYTVKEAESPVLRSESEVNADGFNYVYETGNGISAQAVGTLKKVFDEDTIVVQGAFQYKTPEGVAIDFTYVADENGYQPKSAAIPVGPPVPEYVLRALEYIRTHPSKETAKPLNEFKN